jgi:hypothetical protein
MRDSPDDITPETWAEWIIDAIRRIRSQKQRPSIQRICQAIGSHHKFHEDIVAEKLEAAVDAGAVLKVYNKGLHSYKAPGTSQRTRRITSVDNDTDLSRFTAKAVHHLGECEGSNVKSIETYVLKSNLLDVTEGTDFSLVIRNSLKQAMNKGLLIQEGKLYKVGKSLSPKRRMTKKKREAAAAAAAEAAGGAEGPSTLGESPDGSFESLNSSMTTPVKSANTSRQSIGTPVKTPQKQTPQKKVRFLFSKR